MRRGEQRDAADCRRRNRSQRSQRRSDTDDQEEVMERGTATLGE